jgi:hypothetical protein
MANAISLLITRSFTARNPRAQRTSSDRKVAGSKMDWERGKELKE